MMKEIFTLKRVLHGKGTVLFTWNPSGSTLVTIGQSRHFHVYSRTGECIFDTMLSETARPLQVDWSYNGEYCSVLCENSSVLHIYHAHERRIREIEMNIKDPSFLVWSRTQPICAIGTAKGALVLYAAQTGKSSIILNKHSKKITGGAWNLANRLALVSADRLLTISDERGELLEQAKLKYDPSDIQFASQKFDSLSSTSSLQPANAATKSPSNNANNNSNANGNNNAAVEHTISINLGLSTLLLYNMLDSTNPIELAFQQKYGEVVAYHWYGDGYIIIGFSNGYVVAISTHMREIGEELHCLKVFENRLTGLAYNQTLHSIAATDGEEVRMIDLNDWKEIKTDFSAYQREEGDIESMQFSADGQILTIATSGGFVFNYVTSLPLLSARYGSSIAQLSSLRTISIQDESDDTFRIEIEVAVEPSFIALGPSHVAIGMNSHIWFYDLETKACIKEREYMGTISSVYLNDKMVAVTCEGRLVVQQIEQHATTKSLNKKNGKSDAKTPAVSASDHLPNTTQWEDIVFPQENDCKIVSSQLTPDFLLFTTTKSQLIHFSLNGDIGHVNEYHHDSPIVTMICNSLGTKIVLFDAKKRGYFYCPVENITLTIPSTPANVDAIYFDANDGNVFVILDTTVQYHAISYVYAGQTIKGPSVNKIGQTKLLPNFAPILCYEGTLVGHKSNRTIHSIVLASHDAIHLKSRRSTEKMRQAVSQYIAMGKLDAAWEMGTFIRQQKELMQMMGRKALEQLNLELAIRIYREMQEGSMVMALNELLELNDRNLIIGHICVLLGDISRAQAAFLNSSEPTEALDMRCDMFQWEFAMKLAQTLAPERLQVIYCSYAQQREQEKDYERALQYYQKTRTEGAVKDKRISEEMAKETELQMKCGIARCSFHVGEFQRGMAMAKESQYSPLLMECAQICEQSKLTIEAAELYALAQEYEKAIKYYLDAKQLHRAAPLMKYCNSPALFNEYGKARESDKAYDDALEAYQKAENYDAIIRILLFSVHRPEQAFELARKTKSAEGASLIAKYCIEHVDFDSAIEFLLVAKKCHEAFAMAKEHGQVDIYARILGANGTAEEYTQLANYYEAARNWVEAGQAYLHQKDFTRSLRCFLRADSEPNKANQAHIEKALEVIKQAHQSGSNNKGMLVRMLHDFLIGESDGKVKDLNYIYRLYIAIGEYAQAATTALLIANQEQACGQYNTAHSILVSIYCDLDSHSLPIPEELRRNLLILHSYRLAKIMSQKGDHDSAARMLIRVSKNISKFPTHTVPILTSTVIECQRAGLKKSSFEYASILMRPEYRSSVDPKYRKPIEAFVRRPLSEEVDEQCSPCPYCAFALPNTALSCANCKNTIPYCCVTGRHMLVDDWTQCPHCRFPGLQSSFSERLGSDSTCPMCTKTISPDSLQGFESKQIQQRLATYATGVLRDAAEPNRAVHQTN